MAPYVFVPVGFAGSCSVTGRASWLLHKLSSSESSSGGRIPNLSSVTSLLPQLVERGSLIIRHRVVYLAFFTLQLDTLWMKTEDASWSVFSGVSENHLYRFRFVRAGHRPNPDQRWQKEAWLDDRCGVSAQNAKSCQWPYSWHSITVTNFPTSWT